MKSVSLLCQLLRAYELRGHGAESYGRFWKLSSKTLIIRATVLGDKQSKRFQRLVGYSLTRLPCKTADLMSNETGNPGTVLEMNLLFPFPIIHQQHNEKRIRAKNVFLWWLWKEPFYYFFLFFMSLFVSYPDFDAHEFGYVGIVYFLGKKMEKTDMASRL